MSDTLSLRLFVGRTWRHMVRLFCRCPLRARTNQQAAVEEDILLKSTQRRVLPTDGCYLRHTAEGPLHFCGFWLEEHYTLPKHKSRDESKVQESRCAGFCFLASLINSGGPFF